MFSYTALLTLVFLIASVQVSARPCSDHKSAQPSASALQVAIPAVTPVATTPVATPAAAAPNTTSEACTQARLDILVDLAVSEDATKKINSTDANTQAAVSAAEEGFKLVQVGIASIANAILTNQAPPPESRDLVGTGIIQVKTALAGINGTDSADPNLALANKTIDLAVDASNRVVDNCK